VQLAGSSALVTGGTSGLGRATARMLAASGASVVVLARRPVTDRSEDDGDISYACGDVCDTAAVTSAVSAAVAGGPLRSLVVCAGYGDHARTIGRDGRYESAHDLDRFRAVLETNLVGAFNCVRIAATAMSRNIADDAGQCGAIVLTSSASAFDGQVGQAAYAASKAGLHGLVLPLARDLASAGVRVNVLVPGAFDTPIYGPGGVDDDLRRRIGEAVVFPRRMGQPAEFANAVHLLLTNDYMNGAVVRLDAGLRTLPR
jgi:NAD(P)-dependent dehydrogenase (short-subunit alcohol dehydrogenase family)